MLLPTSTTNSKHPNWGCLPSVSWWHPYMFLFKSLILTSLFISKILFKSLFFSFFFFILLHEFLSNLLFKKQNKKTDVSFQISYFKIPFDRLMFLLKSPISNLFSCSFLSVPSSIQLDFWCFHAGIKFTEY